MISSAASIIAMEYQYGTLKMLLYRQFSRLQVFMSKMLTIVIHLVTLQTLATVTGISLTLMAFPKYDVQQHLLKQLSEALSEVLMVLLLLSLVILLATCFRSNAAAIASGFISYFGIQLIGSFLLLAVQRWEWLKWSPLTMMMFSAQIEEPQITRFTHLNTLTLGIGATFYLVGFMMVAYSRFRKQPV
jgi:ABC-2 type transport system permease protein